ncbi:MAG: hypothetical protein RLZZ387_1718 [Chloroflexota bacterium]|jgi:hypothetical protein
MATLTRERARATPAPSFTDYYVGTLIRPRRTFAALMQDTRRLRFGSTALAVNAALCTVVYVFLARAGGAPSSFTPWLAIPAEVYYRYNQFFLAPSMAMCWILAAGVDQLLSHLFGGLGSREDLLGVFGFGLGVASLAALVHDLPDSFLGAIGVLDLRWYETALNSPTIWRTVLWICYGPALIWAPTLCTIGVAVVQRIRRGPAVLVGVRAFLAY